VVVVEAVDHDVFVYGFLDVLCYYVVRVAFVGRGLVSFKERVHKHKDVLLKPVHSLN